MLLFTCTFRYGYGCTHVRRLEIFMCNLQAPLKHLTSWEFHYQLMTAAASKTSLQNKLQVFHVSHAVRNKCTFCSLARMVFMLCADQIETSTSHTPPFSRANPGTFDYFLSIFFSSGAEVASSYKHVWNKLKGRE